VNIIFIYYLKIYLKQKATPEPHYSGR